MKRAVGLALAAAVLWAASLMTGPHSTRDSPKPPDPEAGAGPSSDEPSAAAAPVTPTRAPEVAPEAPSALPANTHAPLPAAPTVQPEADVAPEPADLPTPNHSPQALRDRFEAEPRDTSWAEPQERRLADLLDAAGARALAATIECRSRVCRIALNGQTSDDAVDFVGIEGLREETGIGPGTQFVIEGDKLAVYFVRQGFQLY